jgi:hypothetical protein
MPTNLEQVQLWHADKPGWAQHLTARDWDCMELFAEKLDVLDLPEPASCGLAGADRYCTLQLGHDGPCNTYPLVWEDKDQ